MNYYCSSLSLVDKFFLFGGSEVITVLVIGLLTVPFVLPGLETEAMVVLATGNEEVAVGDGIIDGKASCGSQGIGVGRQFSAFHEESSGIGVLLNGGLGKSDHTWFDLLYIDLLTEGDSLEAWNILGTDDDISFLLSVNTALISDQVTHGFQSLAISGHDNDTLVLGESTGNGWELSQG